MSNQVNQDYSEWFLGHSRIKNITHFKDANKREIYASKVMKYLTFLDYTTLEATGKDIEAKLSEKEKEIQLLREHQKIRDDALSLVIRSSHNRDPGDGNIEEEGIEG